MRHIQSEMKQTLQAGYALTGLPAKSGLNQAIPVKPGAPVRANIHLVRDDAPSERTTNDKSIIPEQIMITLDALLVFLGAAALPAIYILIVSRWIEPEFRKTSSDQVGPKATAEGATLVRTAA